MSLEGIRPQRGLGSLCSVGHRTIGSFSSSIYQSVVLLKLWLAISSSPHPTEGLPWTLLGLGKRSLSLYLRIPEILTTATTRRVKQPKLLQIIKRRLIGQPRGVTKAPSTISLRATTSNPPRNEGFPFPALGAITKLLRGLLRAAKERGCNPPYPLNCKKCSIGLRAF